MKMIPDPTGRFRQRPYFDEAEIDNECSFIVIDYLQQKGKRQFIPPLRTDDLTCMIEEYADDLDLFADLDSSDDKGVEGVTEFRLSKRPVVRIEKRLSEEAWRSNRLRTTLAHEYFHVRYHNVLWQLEWASQPSLSKGGKGAACHENAILIPPKADWLEWQAAYGSGAILMPKASVIEDAKQFAAAQPANGHSPNGSILEFFSQRYEVSQDAARVRLQQLRILTSQE